jgi:hypothetical protein
MLSSCASPTEIIEYTKIVDRAATDFPKVAEIIVTTCVLQARHEKLSDNKLIPRDIETTLSLRECKQSIENRDHLLKAHHVLEEYLRTLRQLSDDKMVQFDTEIDKNVDAVGSFFNLNDDQKGALKGLAGAIAKAATDGYRRNQLKQLIDQANGPFQKSVAVLKSILDKEFKDKFKTARDQIVSFYNGALVYQQQRDSGHESIEARQWKLQADRQLEKSIDLQDGVVAYSKILDEMAAGHKALYDQRNNWKSKDLATLLYESGSKIRSEYNKVVKAFQPQPAA